MIKFLGKFTRDGNIVAWRISEDGVESNIAFRAVYHEFYFDEMRNSGYVFHDYNGNITTPDGYNLSDIVESNEYLSDTELIDLIDVIESGGMKEEKDIVQYFDRNIKVEFVELDKPISIDINTREEFLEYLKTIKIASDKGIRKFSPLPINAFANPEALFTLEELAANADEAAVKFSNLYTNTIMTDIEAFNTLIQKYNIDLEHSTPNQVMVDILKGFFRWGVPGLNAKVTNVRYEMTPVMSFRNINETIENNMLLKYCLKRRSDGKFFCEDVTEGRDYYAVYDDSVDTDGHIGPLSINSIKPEKAGPDTDIVAYGYKNLNPRIIIDLLSNDGISATFIADVNEAHLYRGSTELVSPKSIFVYRTIDGVNIPLSRLITNGIKYISDSVLIRSYIEEKVRTHTVEPKFKSTFDLLVGTGVSPYYAPMYITRMIKEGAPTYVDISNEKEFCSLHRYCSNTFRDGFSKNIIEKYGTGEDDFEDRPIDEQLEFINEEISNLESKGMYLVKPEISKGSIKIADPAYNEWFDEYMGNEVNNVNFVMSLLNGEQNTGRLAIGMKLDSAVKDIKLFNIIYSAYCMAKSDMNNLTIKDFLLDVINHYVDEYILFGERTQTAIGCLKDIVTCRSNMAFESQTLMYVTKIFRENGNAELNQCNRHWGFECVVFDKASGTYGGQIYNAIYEQIMNDMATNGYTEERIIAGSAAAVIIIGMAFSKEPIVSTNGVCIIPYSTTLPNGNKYSVDIKIGETYYNKVRSGGMFLRKYSSCYDFCENQFNDANLNCNIYCVNANINPWAVTPVEGLSIMEYNIFINYFKMSELASVYPETIINKIESTGAKVVPCLREAAQTSMLSPTMDSIFSKDEEAKLAKEGFFLERREYEDLDAYITRTTADIKEAKKEGIAVKNTLLKSDVQLDMFKPYVYLDGVDVEQTYYDEFTVPITNRHISVMAPRRLSSNWLDNLISSQLSDNNIGSVKMERIKFQDIPFESKVFNSNLCLGLFNPAANVYLSRGKLYYKGNNFKVISTMTEDDLEELASDNIAIQINSSTYLIKTIHGLLKVSV